MTPFCDNPLCVRHSVKVRRDTLVITEVVDARTQKHVMRHLYATQPNFRLSGPYGHPPANRDEYIFLCDTCHHAATMAADLYR